MIKSGAASRMIYVRADPTCVRFDRRVITYVNSPRSELLHVDLGVSLSLSLCYHHEGKGKS